MTYIPPVIKVPEMLGSTVIGEVTLTDVACNIGDANTVLPQIQKLFPVGATIWFKNQGKSTSCMVRSVVVKDDSPTEVFTYDYSGVTQRVYDFILNYSLQGQQAVYQFLLANCQGCIEAQGGPGVKSGWTLDTVDTAYGFGVLKFKGK